MSTPNAPTPDAADEREAIQNHHWRALAETLLKATRWDEWRANGWTWQAAQIDVLSEALRKWLPESAVADRLVALGEQRGKERLITRAKEAEERWQEADADRTQQMHRADRNAERATRAEADLAAAEQRIKAVEQLLDSWPTGDNHQEYRRGVNQARDAVREVLRADRLGTQAEGEA